jgi:hypothetical protein
MSASLCRGCAARFGGALASALLVLPSTASASLGSDASSVELDAVEMRASDRLVEATDHVVHEMRLPGGTLVRQYVSVDGRVFGVTWRGPFRPDLSRLMGSHFAPFAAAAQAARASRTRRGPLDVRAQGLVVQMSGRTHAFHGRAYLPDLVPKGFPLEEMV